MAINVTNNIEYRSHFKLPKRNPMSIILESWSQQRKTNFLLLFRSHLLCQCTYIHIAVVKHTVCTVLKRSPSIWCSCVDYSVYGVWDVSGFLPVDWCADKTWSTPDWPTAYEYSIFHEICTRFVIFFIFLWYGHVGFVHIFQIKSIGPCY